MKQWIFLSVCGCMLMAACAKEEGLKVNNEAPGEGRVVFDVSVMNQAGDGFGSRARDLYSQEGLQEVTRVQVHAFQKNGDNYLFYKTFNVDKWGIELDTATYLVPEIDELPPNDYRFIGLGQEASDNYAITALSNGVTNFNDVTASITNLGDEQEFFAGTATANIASEGARVRIELTRKISGVLAYFKNVPVEIAGDTVRYLRLSVSNANKSVSLVDGTGSAPTGTPYNVIDLDLSGQGIANGVYTGNDPAAGVEQLTNSQLAGEFVMPVNDITMTLGLYDKNGVALKTWNIVSSVSGTTTFSLTPNNFYSLGRKVFAGSTDGTDPDGETDPSKADDAVDLLTDQQIIVTIDTDWGVIDQLTLQP